MKRGVSDLKHRGVVLPRGRYLYVSPDLLAIKAAAEIWDARGADLIRIVGGLPGGFSSAEQLLLRLAMMMARHVEVRRAVERMLGDEGSLRQSRTLTRSF